MKHLSLLMFLSVSTVFGESLPEIRVPPGFTAELWAEDLDRVRALTFGPDGSLFAGSRAGLVYAVFPDGSRSVLASGLEQPVGVTLVGDDLYISAISRIWRIPGAAVGRAGRKELVSDAFPTDRHHGWKFIAVGPDGLLYVPVGAPCNVCHPKDARYSTIMRMATDGTGLEIFASGVRNTVGFDWHPDTKELWFTDNGRDGMGDDIPPDELNHAPRGGLHFGFPFLHGREVEDPNWGKKAGGRRFEAPRWELPAHVAPLGMRFGRNLDFPKRYREGIFIAEHGSWNRSSKIGYRVSFLPLKGNTPVGYEIFASGWLVGERSLGRPADVAVGPDGALYVSDDQAGRIWRIAWTGNEE